MPRRRIAPLLLLSLGLLSACGDSSSSGGITVHFVGNSSCPTDGGSPYSPSPPNTNGPPVGQPIDEMPHTHVAPPVTVQYMHDPPTSGCHYSLGNGVAPIAPGVYPSNRVFPAEYWVHNLEHGYIVVTYKCPSGCDVDLQTLNSYYHSLPPDPGGVSYAKFIAVPWPSQHDNFDVLSWDWFDSLGTTLNMDEVKRFYANHVNQSSEGASAG